MTNFALWEMYNLPMIVYGELLFIENMIIGWVLLYLTGQICGRRAYGIGQNDVPHQIRAYKWRLIAGGIMCGAFSMVIFLDAKAPVAILMEVCFALAVCTVVFGMKGIPWRHAIAFVLVTYFMGGVTMGLLLVTKQQGIYTAVGIYTGDMKAALLAVFITLGYMTAMQMIKTVRRAKLHIEYSYSVTIVCGDERIEAGAFLDTGNRLIEPISGKPVAVASEELWLRIQRCGTAPRLALVPYETVGSKGLLEAVRIDLLEVGGRKIRKCYIARGNGLFDMGSHQNGTKEDAGYELLLSAEMADMSSGLTDIDALKGEKGS